jgi:hypothetical protein
VYDSKILEIAILAAKLTAQMLSTAASCGSRRGFVFCIFNIGRVVEGLSLANIRSAKLIQRKLTSASHGQPETATKGPISESKNKTIQVRKLQVEESDTKKLPRTTI